MIDNQSCAIEAAAQKILDVLAKYQGKREAILTNYIINLIPSLPNTLPTSTLADLYDELTMPADLRKAHRANDCAVAVAYGFEHILKDETATAVALLKFYKDLTS